MANDSNNHIEGDINLDINVNKNDSKSLMNANNRDVVSEGNIQKVPVSSSDNYSSARNSVDKSSAIGYNQSNIPNIDNISNNSNRSNELFNKPGLDDESLNKESVVDANNEPYDSKEQAPDIGKDYGSEIPHPNDVGNNAANNEGNSKVENNNVNSGANSNVNQNANSLQNPQKSLEKKDDLGNKDDQNLNKEEDKDDKNDSKTDDLEDKVKKDDSDINPEAPNPKQPSDAYNEKNRKDNNLDDNMDGSNQGGNGYGALKNMRRPNPNATTDNAKKNLEHSNRIKKGNDSENNVNSKGNESELESNERISKHGFKNPFGGLFGGKNKNSVSKGDGNDDERKDNSFSSNMGFNSGSVIKFLLNNPIVLCALIVVLFFLFLLLFFSDAEFNGGGNGVCTYELNGILDSGPVSLKGVQVELVNCDAKSDNYTVLETIDFERYVIGVTVSEVGYDSVNNPELYKSQIVAARNYALLRNRAMCPSHPDDCFYGYNPNTGKIRMRACTNDQVYCDIEKDCYRKTRGDAPALVGPELHEGDEGAYVWKAKPSEELKEKLISVANEVKGAVLVDSANQVVYTGFVDDDQQAWRAMANQGMKYDEILSTHFNVNGGHIYQANCTSGNIGNIDYGDYTLSSDGDAILHEPLETFLQKNGSSLEEFNALIAKNVDKAGYGTRAGTVAAAVTLIGELGDQFNVKVPYYWGGGHGDGIATGAKGNWGSTACHTYANNRSYDYCGLDCSGFVPWAINNGGFNVRQNLAGNFQNLSGARRVSLSNSAVLQPGDLLESSHHVVLVIGIDESSNSYICAEASGGAYGVLFTRRSFNLSGYWGVDMTGYYEANAKSK